MRPKLKIHGSPSFDEIKIGTDTRLYEMYGTELFITNDAKTSARSFRANQAILAGGIRAYNKNYDVPIYAMDNLNVTTEVARAVSNVAIPYMNFSSYVSLACLMYLTNLGTIDAEIGNIKIPDHAFADALIRNIRYDPATDTFEIYDGAAWNPH